MKGYRLWLLFFVAFVYSSNTLASDYEKQEDKFRKRAYKYRDDISKNVYKKIKSWSRPAVLHSDWIENPHGRSIDLQGNELFPSIDYIGLHKIDSCRYSIIKYIGGQKKIGVIHANGEYVIPVDYNTLQTDLIYKGYVIAKKTVGLTEQSDVYTSDGVCLCSLQDVVDIGFTYEPAYNTILVSYKKKNATNGKMTYAAYYPDGICFAGPVEADNAEAKGRFEYYTAGRSHEVSDTIFNGQPHPTLNIHTNAQIEREVKKLFFDNFWIKKADEFCKEKKYQKALDCYRFFGEFEDYIFSSSGGSCTSAEVLYYALLLETIFNTGDYKTIIDGVTGNTLSWELTPWRYGMHFDPQTKSFSCTLSLYQEHVRNLVAKLQDTCTKIYSHAVAAENQRQQRNAQLWGAILGAVATGTANALTGGGSKNTTTATSRQGTNTASAASVPVVSSTTSNSSASSEPSKKPCRVCNGTGREPHETYMGSASAGKKKWCSDCGKEVYVGHSHRTCSLCKGTGLY